MHDPASPATDTAAAAQALLQRVFGYPHFRAQQAQIVTHLAEGGDALVLMPTGGGKSLCYQIPALLRGGVGVVISPLIALMQDQVAALTELGVRAAFLNSSQSHEENTRIARHMREGQLDLVYIAPERLLTGHCLDLLAATPLALFAIDEAHCVSQWGHDFRPEYIRLSILHERFPGVPRIALTATADQHTRAEIIERLQLEGALQFVDSFDRPNIRYQIVEKDRSREQLLDFIRAQHRGDAGIVYCLSRRKTEEVAEFLSAHGVPALAYHAGMPSELRATQQMRFLREDGWVMCATIAFGMGIDKPDVRFVAHLDLPRSIESYYQETGRAGRDGGSANAWMAYGLNDVVQQRRMIEESEASDAHKTIQRGKLDAMLGLCETISCRRMHLLAYFGQSSTPCGNCDTCLTPPDSFDGSVAAQKLLSTIYRVGQHFAAGHVIDVLRGEDNERLRSWQHQTLSTFGIGAETSEAEWRAILRQLIALGYVSVDAQQYNALLLTPKARSVLRGEEKVTLRRYRKAAKAVRHKRLSATDMAHTQLDDPAQALFEKLRWWRVEMAREHNVPAYVIFTDQTLREIARTAPRARDALSGISGIGSKKLNTYGDALLTLIANHAEAQRS